MIVFRFFFDCLHARVLVCYLFWVGLVVRSCVCVCVSCLIVRSLSLVVF